MDDKVGESGKKWSILTNRAWEAGYVVSRAILQKP